MKNWKFGNLSVEAADRLFGDKSLGGLRVRYELHPTNTDMAVSVHRVDTGKFIGGYVSIGPTGIIT